MNQCLANTRDYTKSQWVYLAALETIFDDDILTKIEQSKNSNMEDEGWSMSSSC